MKIPTEAENYRTDLAIERLDAAQEVLPEGVSREEITEGGMKITTVKITDSSSAKIMGKDEGIYITIEPTDFQKVPGDFDQEVELIAEQLKKVFPEKMESALIIGLGNDTITPDALGPQAVRYLLVTRHFAGEDMGGLENMFSVSALAPGVLGQTGIESAEVVSSICAQTKPDLVMVIDALASKSLSRLGKTIQIADSGISPGSGVLNQRKELSRQTLGVPVVSLGVPTVVDLRTIVTDYVGEPVPVSGTVENMFVTPRGIDVLIEHAAKTISYSINKALHPSLSVADIAALVS